jgi:3'-phosphoadenosine 5'-phosphosulfate sulfotransferase (PAPS reductase)/FAD synthetase
MPAPLDPIQSANALIDKAVSYSPYLIVWTSAGKDSTVIADLVHKARKRHPQLKVAGCFLYHVKGLSFFERPLQALSRRLDMEIFQLPHYRLSDYFRAAFYRQPTKLVDEVAEIRKVDLEWAISCIYACHLSGVSREAMWTSKPCDCPVGQKILTGGRPGLDEFEAWCGKCNRETGQRRTPAFEVDKLVVDPSSIWLASGERLDDSPQRRGMLSQTRHEAHGMVGLWERFRRIYPIAHWKTRDVHAYIRVNNLPLPPQLGRKNQSGMGMTPEGMAAIRQNYPEDFEKILAQFPLAEAQAIRAHRT